MDSRDLGGLHVKNVSYIWALVMGLFAGTIVSNTAFTESWPPAPPPHIPYQTFKRLQAQPELLKQLLAPPVPSAEPAYLPRGPSPWSPLANQPPCNPGAMLLLTDGTLMVQDLGTCNCGGGNWWRFTPDIIGSYLNGTWSQLSSLPAGYAPLYFASALLADGRIIIEGGEDNGGKLVWTNQGAIYDPLANSWTPVAPPSGWAEIGDASGIVLANGRFMVAGIRAPFYGQALFNPASLSWAQAAARRMAMARRDGPSCPMERC
jgi:hypothetical protein